MLRRLSPLFLIAAIVSPQAVLGQETEPQAGSDVTTATDEAQVFLGAFRAISQMHVSALGDSALWERAIDGLIQEVG